MSDENNSDAIVAIMPCCNRLVFACINNARAMNDEMRKEVGTLVSEGCRIEHWTVDAVRKSQDRWVCTCKANKAELRRKLEQGQILL